MGNLVVYTHNSVEGMLAKDHYNLHNAPDIFAKEFIEEGYQKSSLQIRSYFRTR